MMMPHSPPRLCAVITPQLGVRRSNAMTRTVGSQTWRNSSCCSMVEDQTEDLHSDPRTDLTANIEVKDARGLGLVDQTARLRHR